MPLADDATVGTDEEPNKFAALVSVKAKSAENTFPVCPESLFTVA